MGSAATVSQNSRSRPMRRSGGLPARMAAFTAPMEAPASHPGCRPAGLFQGGAGSGLEGAEGDAARQHQGAVRLTGRLCGVRVAGMRARCTSRVACGRGAFRRDGHWVVSTGQGVAGSGGRPARTGKRRHPSTVPVSRDAPPV